MGGLLGFFLGCFITLVVIFGMVYEGKDFTNYNVRRIASCNGAISWQNKEHSEFLVVCADGTTKKVVIMEKKE